MSLAETNLLSVVKAQYNYKLKANARTFIGLIMLQLLGFLLSSLNGVGTTGGSYGNATYLVKHYTGDFIIVFTLIWAFITGINTAAGGYKLDFTFVTNRLSSHLSGLAFLLTASIIGGVTATLCGLLLRIAVFFTHRGAEIVFGFWIPPLVLISSIYIAILYIFLVSSLGYFVGTLVQRNRIFNIVLPAAFFGTLFMDARNTNDVQLLVPIIKFFIKESSYVLFSLKVILVSALLFGCIVLISKRMEVRR
ncbi:hypothetical protein [Desulfofalx alkaliphila]|uniref:hypothetical protein n=1 Tax=Desulfofalx alkaliphila TaxID=105483 RepID=UPI0004E25625|nr:hypothetical protein [Desulfofalx alkaliphila]